MPRPGGARRGGGRRADAATMWESLNGGEDPTEDDQPSDRRGRGARASESEPSEAGISDRPGRRGNVNVSRMHSGGKLPGGLRERRSGGG